MFLMLMFTVDNIHDTGIDVSSNRNRMAVHLKLWIYLIKLLDFLELLIH